MSILLNPYGQSDEWADAFARELPDEMIHVWPDCPDPADVEMLIAWRMRRDDLATFVNLRAILSMGAGAEQWQKEGSPEVPIVRLHDPTMSDDMAAYAVHWVLRLQRCFDVTDAQQRRGIWQEVHYPPASQYPVGVLGFGRIGRRVAEAFIALGHPVNAWSRSGGSGEGIAHYAGAGELEAFLGASDAVVNVLPSTPDTMGLMHAETFGWMRDGSVFVNMGRGSLVVEDDLIAALDGGRPRAAVLDVTEVEPTPPDSPLWTHPGVTLTPHIAGVTRIDTSAAIIAANVRRIRAGEQPFPVVDRSLGY